MFGLMSAFALIIMLCKKFLKWALPSVYEGVKSKEARMLNMPSVSCVLLAVNTVSRLILGSET